MALSFNETGKYTSERHELAKQSGKLTSGEASKIIKKKGLSISAKETVEAFKLLTGSEPEWHHAGFYKGKSGSTMGRTFFFTDDQVDMIFDRYSEIAEIRQKKEDELQVKKETTVKGFYFVWTYDYGGKYGKKRNYKVMKTYDGNKLDQPHNFTSLTDEEFEVAKSKEGKTYFGWDEPIRSEFQK